MFSQAKKPFQFSITTGLLALILACSQSDDSATSDVGYQNDDSPPEAHATALLLGKPRLENDLEVYTARANTEVVLTGKDSDSEVSPIIEFDWEQLDAGNYPVTLISRTRNTVAFNTPNVLEPTRLNFKLTITDGFAQSQEDFIAVDVIPANDSDHFLSHPTQTKNQEFYLQAVLAPEQSIGSQSDVVIQVENIIHWENRLKQADSLVLESYQSTLSFSPDFTADYTTLEAGLAHTGNPIISLSIPRIDADDINQHFQVENLERRIEPYLIDDARLEIRLSIVSAPENIQIYALDHQNQALEAASIDNQLGDQDVDLASPSLLSLEQQSITLDVSHLLDALGIENAMSAEQYYDILDGDGSFDRLEDWLSHAGFLNNNGDWASDVTQALYINNYDLGFTRDMYSRKDSQGNVYSFVTNYPNLQAGINNVGEFALVAMEYSPDPANLSEKIVKFYAYIFDARSGGFKLAKSLNFDGRGEKYVPGACTGCHQGNVDIDKIAAGNADLGATFIPWEISAFLFTAAEDERLVDHTLNHKEVSEEQIEKFSREAQEDAIRTLNEHALTTYQADKERFATSIELVHGWYGSLGTGDRLPSNATFDEHYVQPGWQGYEELYHGAFAQYCRLCHSQMPPGVKTFDSYEKFMQKSDLITDYVYQRGIMPLARLSMDRFWVNFYGEESAADILRNHLISQDTAKKSVDAYSAPGAPVILINAQPRLDDEESPINIGETIQFDAKASRFSDSYHWTLIQQPENSTAKLESNNSPLTKFSADQPGGEYIIELKASNENGLNTSETITVNINNRTPQGECLRQLVTNENISNAGLIEQINIVSTLNNIGDGNVIIDNVIAGQYGEAIISDDGQSLSYQLYDPFVRGQDYIYYQVKDFDGSVSASSYSFDDDYCENEDYQGYSVLFIDAPSQFELGLIPQNLSTSLDEQNNSHTIHLSWESPTDIIAENFAVYMYEEDSLIQTLTLSGSLNSYSFTGLSPNTNYSFEVSSILDGHESIRSNRTSNLRTLSIAVENLSANPAESIDQLTIQWQRTEANIDSYTILLDQGLSSEQTITLDINDLDDSSAPSFLLSDLIAGHNYSIQVSANNGVEESSPSNSIQIAPLAIAPSGLSLQAGSSADTTIILDWDDAEGERLHYKVYQSATDPIDSQLQTTNTYIVPASTSTKTISGLTPYKVYTFYVTAINAQGEETQSSNTEQLRTAAADGQSIAPSISNITLGALDASDIELSIEEANAFNATAYKLYRYLGNDTATLDDSFMISIDSEGKYLDQGLNHNQAYTYVISAFYDQGDGSEVESDKQGSATITTKSLNVSNFKAQASSIDSITISWEAVSASNVNYQLSRLLENDNNPELIQGGVTSPTMQNVAPASNYRYILSVSQGGQSVDSTEVNVSTAPAIPTGLFAESISSSQIRINWNSSGDNFSYDLQVSENQVDWMDLESNINSLVVIDSGKSDDSDYYYRLRAKKNGLDSEWTAGFLTGTVSLIPTALSAEAASSETEITLNWQAPQGTTVSEYRILKDGVQIGTSTTTTYTDDDLMAGNAYSYTVRAYDGIQESEDSNSVTKYTLPAKVEGLSASDGTPSHSSIRLAWVATTAASYNIYNADTENLLTSSNTNSIELNTNIDSYKAYNFSIKSVNADGEESIAFSDPVRHITDPIPGDSITPSITSLNLDSNLDASQFTLSWDKPDASNPTAYRINRFDSATNTGSKSVIDVGSATTASFDYDDGIRHNSDYTFEVEAYYDQGDGISRWSEPSSAASIQTQSLIVNSVNEASSPSTNRINLEWSAPTAKATSYSVYREGSVNPIATNVTTLSYSDTSVSAGQEYGYKVIAHQGSESSALGDSTYSTLASKPAAPSVTSFSGVSSTSITVNWTNEANTSYDVEWRKAGDAWANNYLVQEANSNTATLNTGLVNGTDYQFRIRAHKFNQLSNWGSVSTESTAPGEARNFSVSTAGSTNNTISLSWDAPAQGSVDSYNIYKNSSLLKNTTNTSSTDDIGFGNSASYYVVAVCDSRTATPTETLEVFTAPDDVSLTSATKHDSNTSGINLSWSAASGASEYRVYYDDGNLAKDNITGTSTTITGLDSYTEYTFNVKAVSADGYESLSFINTGSATTRISYNNNILSTCNSCHGATDATDRIDRLGNNWPTCLTSDDGDCSIHITSGCSGGSMCFSSDHYARERVRTWVSEGSNTGN